MDLKIIPQSYEKTYHPFPRLPHVRRQHFAQQHLSFKGVPINGTMKSYTDAMVKAGFHYEITQDGTTALRNLEKLNNGQAVSNIKEYPRTAVFDVVQYWKEK